MKVVMAGYEKTKKIISASSYLVHKYLKGDFDVRWVNVGEWDGKLYCGSYDSMGDIGPTPSEWLRGLTSYLQSLDDEFIVWGADEFFLSKPTNGFTFGKLLKKMQEDEDIVCAKLCISNFHDPSEYEDIGDQILMLNATAKYSSVVQFGLWRREFLIKLLSISRDPWDFERDGSERLNATGKKVILPKVAPFRYPTRTATSGTHPGKVSVLGNQEKDVEFLISEGHLNREELIMGLWPGEVKTWDEGKNDQFACLEGNNDRAYNEMELHLCLD